MFKSLRWRLQVWHAMVLLVVLTIFGGVVYSLQWQTRLQQIDAELNRTATLVISQWRRLLPPPRFRSDGRRQRRPDGTRVEGEAEQPVAVANNATTVAAANNGNPVATTETPPAEVPPAEAAATPAPRRERPFVDPGPLPEEFQQQFRGDEDSAFYFIIWDHEGKLLQKSESAPDIEYPDLHAGKDRLPVRVVRSRKSDHTVRESIHAVMWDMNLLVGRSLEKDLAAHHRTGFLLITAGTLILAAGVLGGGWLSARAIRPINEMTTTAESISADNLSERINLKETDDELGKLATVLNRTFDRLESAFEKQRQFTADASHELRTPLSVISAHTELALSRPRSDEEYRAAIETCQRASYKMKSLIDSLLLLARFDSGSSVINEAPLDLGPLIRDSVEMVEPLAAERQIAIDCQITPCQIVGDWNRLSQVVTNLLTNAIRYNVDGGKIRVTVRPESSKALISVADTGIGIGQEELPQIFDRFYQVDKARSRAEGSCGLGLAICKSIVEAHRGTILATSQSGKGTTIEVRLPLAREHVDTEPLSTSERQLASATVGTG